MSYLNKPDEARIVFSRVLSYYLIGFGALVVLFFFAAKPITLLMTAPAFHEAHLIVGLVAAGLMLKGCYLIVLPGIYFAEKLYKQSAIEWVAAIANIVLNLWLIPLFGIVGAALATFVSYLTLPIFAWLVARQYLKVDYEWQRLVKISMAIFLASALIYFLSVNFDVGLVLTIVINAVVLISFIIVSYRLLITVFERKQFWSRLRS
jgi:O-antigen/teichoic acid export membrane protein